jgi:hypothetical protein
VKDGGDEGGRGRGEGDRKVVEGKVWEVNWGD